MAKKALILTVFLFFALVQPIGYSKPVSTTKTGRIQFSQADNVQTVDWNMFWSAFNSRAIWDLQYYNGSNWMSRKQLLDIIRDYPEENVMKFSLNFTSTDAGPYRLYLVVDETVKEYAARISNYCYTLEYGGYSMIFNWTDIMSISNLQVEHGVQSGKFYFVIRHDNVPADYNLFIDPTFKASDYSPTKDAYVEQQSPGTNYGTSQMLKVESFDSNRNKRVYVDFDTSTITKGCTIINATLKLYRYSGYATGRTYRVLKVNESWTETGITWSNQPTVSGDYVDESAPQSDGWWNVNVTDIFESDTSTSYSIRDTVENDPGDYYCSFRSKEYTGTDYDPILEVCFEYEYMYTFDGEYYEDGSDAGDVCVDIHFENFSQSHFTVDGITQVYLGEIPLFYSWPVDQYLRVFYPPSNDTIKIFSPQAPYNVYSFTITDYSGTDIVDETAYLESYRIIQNEKYLLERRNVKDFMDIVPLLMEEGASYLLILNTSQTTHRFGMWLAGSTTEVWLKVTGIDFSPNIKDAYRYVRVEAVRTDSDTVTVNYEDVTNQTNQVDLEIHYRNGTVAHSDSSTENQVQFQWNQADNETSYMTETVIDHELYGTLTFRYEVLYTPGFNPPFNLSMLGTWPIDPTILIPVGIILSTASLVSAATVPGGIFGVLLVSGTLFMLGWIQLDVAMLTDAAAFGFIIAIVFAKKKVGK